MWDHKIGLFIPCYIDQLYPRAGIAAFETLRRLGLNVSCPPNQLCCGQPLANSGAACETVALCRRFADSFLEYDYIVCPSSSCVYHIRHHYEKIARSEKVEKICDSIYELCEFIVDVLGIDDMKLLFPHKVGIHHSCHGLRGLELASTGELIQPRYSKVHSLLEKAEGITLTKLDREDECCGFGGTFSVFEPHVSVRMGTDRLSDHLRNGSEFITATDMSCLMHLEAIIRRQRKKAKVIHVAEILKTCRV
ncbi:MAG: (Fe-S)-binding protein [Tannerellaceae bacterium]|jgi:L-lactate dehydrogenase complex protein LldE|nr:(Fe-S)-binding protein [Tannerellaceae bacterium]